MATSFNSGFKLGTDMYNQGQRNRLAEEELGLAKERSARDAEVHGQTMKEGGLRLEAARRVDDATRALTNAQSLGIGLPENQEANMGLQRNSFRQFEIGQQNYGAEAPAYQAPTGLQPAYRPATDMDINSLAATVAAAKGDIVGMESTRMSRQGMQKNEIAARVMKLPLAELEKRAPEVTKSGYPMLYTGKDKSGYTFLKTEADGVTPIPGSQFTVNESQLRQFAMAAELGDAGFGTDALTLLSSAHKDMGDHIGKWNAAISGVTAANNQATNFANDDDNKKKKLAVDRDVANSQIGLRDAQVGVIEDQTANRTEAAKLISEYDALTPEEQNGAKGLALTRQFVLNNAKAGGQVSLGGAGSGSGRGKGSGGDADAGVTIVKNDDGTQTAYPKDGRLPSYTTYNGAEIPKGMDLSTYQGMIAAAKENGVALELVETRSGNKLLKYVGVDGKYYDVARLARNAKPPPEAKPPEAKPDTPQRGLKVPSTQGNPYRVVRRGGPQIDRASLDADMREYTEFKDDNRPIVQGRVKLLAQKLRAAGAIE